MTTLTLSRTGRSPLTFEDLRGLRAEGYIRDSTLDQRDGFGPDIQRHNIQRFAASYGLVLGDRYYTEFVSGRHASKRLQFQQFREDARVNAYDVLLVDHTSRFGRNQQECIMFKSELQGLGKSIVFVSQGIISGSDRDFLSERINETLDEVYSRNLSRYITDGNARKAEAGQALGNAPLGFTHVKAPDGKGVLCEPDDRTMPGLLALLGGYTTGKHSFASLARELNMKGYRTSEGKPFTQSSISTALNNIFYNGKVLYHRGRADEAIRDGVHQVPSRVKELWGRCQEVRRERATRGKPAPRVREQRAYPLTGVLVCDGCGEPLHGTTVLANGREYPRMMHSVRRCEMRPESVSSSRLEHDFGERVLSCVQLDDGWREAVLRAICNESPEPDHSLEVRRIEGALANLRKQHLWGAITDEEFKAEHRELSRQLAPLMAPKATHPIPDLERAARLLQDMPALWQHPGVSQEQRRDFAGEMFQGIRLREGRLVAVQPRPAYAPLFAYSIWRHNVIGADRPS